MTTTPQPQSYDPTEMQFHAWDAVGLQALTEADLARPEAVKLLLTFHRLTAAHLMASEKKCAAVASDNRTLRSQRETLRINNARLESQSHYTWVEIPISILTGFAVNILTRDYHDGLGWALLVTNIAILLFLRFPWQRLFGTSDTTTGGGVPNV